MLQFLKIGKNKKTKLQDLRRMFKILKKG